MKKKKKKKNSHITAIIRGKVKSTRFIADWGIDVKQKQKRKMKNHKKVPRKKEKKLFTTTHGVLSVHETAEIYLMLLLQSMKSNILDQATRSRG